MTIYLCTNDKAPNQYSVEFLRLEFNWLNVNGKHQVQGVNTGREDRKTCCDHKFVVFHSRKGSDSLNGDGSTILVNQLVQLQLDTIAQTDNKKDPLYIHTDDILAHSATH